MQGLPIPYHDLGGNEKEIGKMRQLVFVQKTEKKDQYLQSAPRRTPSLRRSPKEREEADTAN